MDDYNEYLSLKQNFEAYKQNVFDMFYDLNKKVNDLEDDVARLKKTLEFLDLEKFKSEIRDFVRVSQGYQPYPKDQK